MECVDRKIKRERKHPRVPLKTYKWEDIRRARRKGGYPWTHLYKEPFYELPDPEQYTMEGMRKARSSSTMGKSEDLDISEVSTFDNQSSYMVEFVEEPVAEIKDTQNHSVKTSCSSLVLDEEQCDDSDAKETDGTINSGNVKDAHTTKEDKTHLSPGMFFLHSEESLDNISQYLDKDERGPPEKQTNKEKLPTEDDSSSRKRKLSAESGRSKVSFGKQVILQKLKDTKEKIKIPKFSFPTKLKKHPKKQKQSSPVESKKTIQKSSAASHKAVQPTYIHIPLKPPPGEVDEYSHLENETESDKRQVKKPGSLRDLVRNLKHLQEPKIEHQLPSPIFEVKEEELFEGPHDLAQENNQHSPIENTFENEALNKNLSENEKNSIDHVSRIDAVGSTEPPGIKSKQQKLEAPDIKSEQKESIEAPDIKSEQKEYVEAPDIKSEQEESNETPEIKSKQEEYDVNIKKVEQNVMEIEPLDTERFQLCTNKNIDKQVCSNEDEDVIKDSEMSDVDVNRQKEVIPDTETSEAEAEKSADLVSDEELFDKLFEASSSRLRTDSQNFDRKGRSKSAEPERKRKLSMESSYSRKSLSKLGILKKLQNAKDKIKNTFSRASSKKDIVVKEPLKTESKPKVEKGRKTVQPVYIHIPLKPPEGVTDEYTYLDDEAPPQTSETIASTPDSLEPQAAGVQFIYLTAPSDDEILDDNSSDIPETPSSENKLFFANKITELKEIAKGAVDVVTTDSRKLAPVTEEAGSNKNSLENINQKVLDEGIEMHVEKSCVKDVINEVIRQQKELEQQKVHHMTIDEEDGLNENKKREVLAQETDNIIEENNIASKEYITEPSEFQIVEEDGINKTLDVNLIQSDEILDLEEAEIEPPTHEEQKELKSVLKTPSSPVMKKKVSFKRKVKTQNNGYEEILVPEQEEIKEEKRTIKSPDVFTSIPVDEEDVYLEEKTVNEIANEDRRNRWSKISDHEYEPVNPPPDTEMIPSITLNNSVCIIDTAQALQAPESLTFDGVPEEDDNEDIQKEPSPKATRVAFSPTIESRSSESDDKAREGPNKFQAAFKQKADNFKHKLQSIKRPQLNIHKPKFQKPNFQMFKIEKKFNMPKIPDTAKINLPSFSLPRMQTKKTVKRNFSTESNAGDSKKPIFDFGTYPRIFKKKPKPESTVSDFATVPRSKKPDSRMTEESRDSRLSTTDSIRIPLHSEDSMDTDKDGYSQTKEMPSDSSDIRQPSHIRYDEGIDSGDEYGQENKELIEERDFLSRWQKGRFNPDEIIEDHTVNTKITDLDLPENKCYDEHSNDKEQRYSSGSSLGIHRQGVLEEINPDEFFLRQKGISQDNIEVGMYLSTEIREAFRNPTNALVQMGGSNGFDSKGSRTSLPEMPKKKKSIKKPKRKKTPHASHEQIPYDEGESGDDDSQNIPPSIPKRRSKRKKKLNEEFIPYQETIPVQFTEDRVGQHRESIDIFADDERENMYENEVMEMNEQPNITITDPYKNYGFDEIELDEMEYAPEAPPRKQKSLKSLPTYENDTLKLGSRLQQVFFDRRVTEPDIIKCETDTRLPERKSYHMNVTDDEIINTKANKPDKFDDKIDNSYNSYSYMDEDIEEFIPEPPRRMQRSLKSLTISENESLTGSLHNNKAIFSSEKNLQEPMIDAIRTESKVIIPIQADSPSRPPRSRGNSRSASQKDLDNLSVQADSLGTDDLVPCTEEPCIQTVCDHMGYSVVDKSKIRDPPLPPPRSLRRKKRSTRLDQENKFFTVPRSKPSKGDDKGMPIRPLRNYSTLGPNRLSVTPDIVEDKENIIDIMQYIEIEDEPNRDLQSGEVIEKMKTRPLPAPPRPPRKSKYLQDITSEENIMFDSAKDLYKKFSGESEVYTQTEPLPDDFVCEEVVQEPTDKIIIPTQSIEGSKKEKVLMTPTNYTYEETITHGSLLVEPLNGAKILQDSDFSEMSKEKIVPIEVEQDFDETSSIPEDFHKLADPNVFKPCPSGEIDILKAQKLQVTDLDVDTLTVNKLLAGKIIVSEIDSGNIQANEISSKTGALNVGEINLPPEVVSRIIETIQTSQISQEKPNDESVEQKKNSD